MDGAPVLALLSKTLSYIIPNAFLPSTVPYWNYCKSLMRRYNFNTHTVVFCLYWCQTSKTDWQRIVETSPYLFKYRKNQKRPEIRIWNSNLIDCRWSSFEDYIHVTFKSWQLVLLNMYIKPVNMYIKRKIENFPYGFHLRRWNLAF